MKYDFFQTKTFRVVILALGIIIFSLVVFWVGMGVGYRRAIFSINGGENYERNFIGPRRPMLGPGGSSFMNDHGTVGVIVSINGDIIIVKSDNGMERSILTATSTTIRQFDQDLSPHDLVVGERIVVVGEPNAAGEIEAKLVRIFPSPAIQYQD